MKHLPAAWYALPVQLEEVAPGVQALSSSRRAWVIAVSLLLFVALVAFAVRQLMGPMRRRFGRRKNSGWGQFV